MGAIPVSDDRWAAEVLAAEAPVVVVLHAPGSSPCRAFSPVLEALTDALHGRARVLALDVEENPVTAQRYEVCSLPTLLVFRGGRLAARMVGGRSLERLLPQLLNHLG